MIHPIVRQVGVEHFEWWQSVVDVAINHAPTRPNEARLSIRCIHEVALLWLISLSNFNYFQQAKHTFNIAILSIQNQC